MSHSSTSSCSACGSMAPAPDRCVPRSTGGCAEPAGEAQVRVALRAIESARQAAERGGSTSRAAHVGYHLIGPARRDLEIDVAWRPKLRQRLRRQLFRHGTACYLGTLGTLTAA